MAAYPPSSSTFCGCCPFDSDFESTNGIGLVLDLGTPLRLSWCACCRYNGFFQEQEPFPCRGPSMMEPSAICYMYLG